MSGRAVSGGRVAWAWAPASGKLRQLGDLMGDRAAMRATELGEAEFVLQRVALASATAARRLGISTARVAGGIVSVMANDPTGGFFNVTVGLGQTEPISQAV